MPDDTRLAAVTADQPAAPPVRDWDLPRTPFAFLMHYIRRGFAGHIALMVGLYGLSTAADTAQTFVLGQLVNTLAGASAANPVMWFAALCSTWLGGYLISNGYAAVFYQTQIAMRVRIHDDLFGYLLEHAPRYFLDQTSGALAHKIRTAASSAVAIIDYIGVHAIRFVILFSAAGVMIARTAPELLLPAGLFVIAICGVSALLAQRLRALAKASSHASSEQAGRMGDAALNWDLVRSFTAALH